VTDRLDRDAVGHRVDAHPVWYHTIDVAPGLATKGWFDLRHEVDALPWPDVRGKRCLDVGTYDGFYAFELERRGAAEVVAVDVDDHRLWDWPPDARGEALAEHPWTAGPPQGVGFRLLTELTGSQADWRPLSIYELDPATVGTFDVVVVGSLLLHLRDPLRALEALRSVMAPDGRFMSVEQIELWLTVAAPHRPIYTLQGSGPDCQWFNSNAAGHHQMLFAAGFEVAEKSKPFVVRFNRHPRREMKSAGELLRRAAFRGLTGSWPDGVLHRALLARHRV
jgi:tRNA (mo5U34)-methyltransferase